MRAFALDRFAGLAIFAAFAHPVAGNAQTGFAAWGRCAALVGTNVPVSVMALPTKGATIGKAELVPAADKNANGEYCLVTGEIVSVDSNAQPIKFSMALPTRWNGKLAQLGGGGWNGAVIPPQGTGTFFGAPPRPLSRGYATIGSDSGHAGSVTDASFMLNDEQARNFAGEQLKKIRDLAIHITLGYYGSRPSRTYFLGGSEGGREAFAVIQNWPQDYDGVIALFPAFNWTANMLKRLQMSQAMRRDNGVGWISPAKAGTLRKAELAACDGLDGLVDEIISNVQGCRFDVATLRCPGGMDEGDSCFSDKQLATLKLAHSRTTFPYKLANGTNSAPGAEIGTDWGSNFVSGKASVRPPPNPSDLGFLHKFGESMIRYPVMRDPTADVLAFDALRPGKWLAPLQAASRLLDQTRTDISAFASRGGKLILIHGLSDELVTVGSVREYYATLVAEHGQAKLDEFLRFYLVPGYGHGRGFSFNANGLPNLDALEDWVERGVSPGTLTVVDANPEARGRSRPLCVFPGWPRYKGQGDPDIASSFECEMSETDTPR